MLRFARNDENSRISYRDPPKGLGDDKKHKSGDDTRLGNSRIPTKFDIKILEFLLRILDLARNSRLKDTP